MHLSYACRAIIFFVYIFPAHYYIGTYMVFVCFCVIYSFITAVCYYFRFLFLLSAILLSHIKVLYAFVFYPVAREYYLLLLIYFSVLLLSYMKVLLCTKLLYAFVFCVVVREYPHRNEKKMSIGGGRFIFTPCAGGCADACARVYAPAALLFPFWRRHFAYNGRKRRNRLNTHGGDFHGLKRKWAGEKLRRGVRLACWAGHDTGVACRQKKIEKKSKTY